MPCFGGHASPPGKLLHSQMSPLTERQIMEHSSSVDQLNGFQFLTSLPIDYVLADTRKATLEQEQRARSVITARYEDEIKRKIKANEARKKLDKVLKGQKDQLKMSINTDFRKTHNDRCVQVSETKKKMNHKAIVEANYERERIKEREVATQAKVDRLKEQRAD